MEVHEFWLNKYSKVCFKSDETLPIYGVALGSLINATDRKTYPPIPYSSSPDFWNKSGSIGFMDLKVYDVIVPIDGARPLRGVKFEFLPTDYEEKKALVIEMIGIEPDHMRKGYTRFLKWMAEEIAVEWGLDTVGSILIRNSLMKDFNVRLGYQLFNRGSRAVKRLKV